MVQNFHGSKKLAVRVSEMSEQKEYVQRKGRISTVKRRFSKKEKRVKLGGNGRMESKEGWRMQPKTREKHFEKEEEVDEEEEEEVEAISI